MNSLSRKAFLAAAVALGCGLLGCSGGGVQKLEETGAVLEGAVTYNGNKVPVGLVIVTGKGGSAQAFADDDGNYKIENAPLGEVQIGVNTDATKGQMMSRAMAGTDPTAKGGKRAAPPKIQEVPKKFHNPETSGLTTSVQKGPNKFDIVIK